jgi:cyclopropane-fatty-acyl-phospholipid synthase
MLRRTASSWRLRDPRLSERIVSWLFSFADVAINGNRPWDIRVRDDRFFATVLLEGSLGLGESYLRSWWACDDLEELFYRLITGGLERVSRALPIQVLGRLSDALVNQQTMQKSLRVAERHYNRGNDLFLSFLGTYKNYSGAYYESAARTLEDAQLAKMEKICRELDLRPGERLLDVGGGWGEFARYAATRYGCRVTSINIADEQLAYAANYCRDANVEIRKCDYREVTGRYDKIAVIAMLTHVGYKNYRLFMQTMDGCLEPGGTILVESVGGHVSQRNCEPWTDKYIFPGGMIPSLEQLDRSIRGLYRRTRLSEFGLSYVDTLRSWHRNLLDAWPTLQQRYGETTRLMFEYFFLSCAGAFRARDLVYWHIVLSKPACAPALRA